MSAETLCRGCRLSVRFVDIAGLCHDCAGEMAREPGTTVEDLNLIMPGPEDVR